MFKCTLYLRQTATTGVGKYTDGPEGVLDEAGGKRHITEAAPNEPKLGEGG